MNKIIAGTIVGCTIVGAALYGPVTTQNHSGDPITRTSTSQSLTVPSTARTSPIHRDTFTATSIPSTDNPFDVPCKSEGDNGCYWDAQRMGNGIGKSYVVTLDGDVYYLDESMSGN